VSGSQSFQGDVSQSAVLDFRKNHYFFCHGVCSSLNDFGFFV
jgi:hypothetical protein